MKNEGAGHMKGSAACSRIHNGGFVRMQLVDELIAFLREANDILQQEVDLSPANLRVTNMIKRLSLYLRSRYLPEDVQAILSDEYIRLNQRSMQERLSKAEYLAELDDSRQLGQASGSILGNIARLPIWKVYMALVGEELLTLRRIVHHEDSRPVSPIVFVGSGPLPLSIIMIHLLGGVEVVGLERDSAAYETSRSLIERMGLASKVTIKLADGAEFDYRPYGQVFVASLVRNKSSVLDRITRTSPGAIVAVRTAEGMKQLMYEAVDESELIRQGWRILDRTLPDEMLVINSTLFLEHNTPT